MMSNNIEKSLESQKELCKIYTIDFKKVKELNSKIALLLPKAMKKKKQLVTISEVLINLGKNMDYWEEIWSLSTSPAANLTPKQKSSLELYLYLVLSEGIFSEIVQVITSMLIENHHDIYDPLRMKFVKKYEELDKVTLFIKLKFVEEHGFKFISDAFDRDLRNCIAHLRYTVKDDGSIIDKRTGKVMKDLRKKTDDLGCVCALTLRAIGVSLEKTEMNKPIM